ncbi:putative F-box protein At1g67623 [Momordica charantia]|uniref:F-box protein At1g67623 n=1 Tax=Momordica charantia TaxID=3673 RepID=A0A6J1CF61_MOMCH|nr:putative F-box protein At1g67623 [Momordica charantia]
MGLQIKRKTHVLEPDHQFHRAKTVRFAAPSAAINSLPRDILVEILAKVAASSFSDLYNAKLANKDFLGAAMDGHVLHHVLLRDLPVFSWWHGPKFSSFIENCVKAGNPEALFRMGMIQFFCRNEEASGLANLKASGEKGHVEAAYVYGVILYRQSKGEAGAEFLRRCESRGGERMTECRRRIKWFVWGMWVKNKSFLREDKEYLDRRRQSCCFEKECHMIKMMGWDWTDEANCYGDDTCERCKWNGEVSRFSNMLRTGGYN